MTWTKLSDTFADDMDADSISCEAITLHIAALIFCNRMGTDGRLPKHITRRLYSDISDVPQAVQQLIEAGHWAETDDGYQIVDFLKDQDSAEMVAHRQELRRNATRKWRAKKDGLPSANNGKPRSTVMHHQPVTGDKKHHGDALPPRPAPKERGGATADGSPGGSPQPQQIEDLDHNFDLAGLNCVINIRANTDAKTGTPDGKARVQFSVTDERAEATWCDYEESNRTDVKLMVRLNNAVYSYALGMARQENLSGPHGDSTVDLYGVEIATDPQDADAWVQALFAATKQKVVTSVAGQLDQELDAMEAAAEAEGP